VRSLSGRAGLVAGAGVLLVAAWASPRAIPYNMDEFVHYHALGCATAPLSRELPSFRDGCGLYDLRLPFTSTPLPLRSYYYIGSLPSVPFYPFWRAIGDPVAARIQGAVFFVLSVALAARLLRVRSAAAVVAGLVFPVFLVTFLVDEGPFGLSAVLLLAALLALRRALGAQIRRSAAAWAVLSGVLLAAGVWVKLVFAWWLPGVAAFALGEGWHREGSIGAAVRRRRAALAVAAVAFLVPTVLLLASVDRDGRTYASALRRGRISAAPEHVQAGAGRLAQYVVQGSVVAPRNLELPPSPVDGLPAGLSAGLLGLATWRRFERRREIVAAAGLAALTFALVASSGFSQWPHHVAFALLWLVLALALALDALGARLRLVAVALVAAFWVTLAVRWPASTSPIESSKDKDALLRFVRTQGLDREALQVHSSWGTYYIAQLFGDPGRMVVYIKGVTDDPRQLQQVRDLARVRGRPLLLLSARRWARLQTPEADAILGQPYRAVRFGAWWAVEYQEQPTAGAGAGSPLVKSASPRR
jgi:hypothetical protein